MKKRSITFALLLLAVVLTGYGVSGTYARYASASKDVYQLEWKWFESSNDTQIGEIAKDYALKISFDGEEILV